MSALDKQVGGGHYKDLEIQPAEYNQRNKLGYCEGNVVKYVTRHKLKHGRQDIEKAIHYLEMLLDFEYPEETLAKEGRSMSDWVKITEKYT